VLQPTRVCSRCHAEKSLEAFPIKDRLRRTRRSYCRPCCRAYGKEHYRRNPTYYKAKAAEARRRTRSLNQAVVEEFLKTNPCVDCGESDPVVLDFDHIEPGSKRGAVARIQYQGSLASLRSEMEKCLIRCGNCHRARTAQQFGWWRSFLAAHE
jgi:hypothetical protein